MSSVAEARQAIYNRLASAPVYHPASADLFTDWRLQGGDIVTVKSDSESYSLPVFGMRVKWTGTTRVSIQSSGNEQRDSIEKMSQAKAATKESQYRRGVGYSSKLEEIHRDLYSEDGQLHSSIFASASVIMTQVENTASGLSSQIVQTAGEIRSDVSAANSQIYSYVRQTASGIMSELANTEEGLYNYTNATASGTRQIIINTTNRTWVQEDDPTTAAGGGHTPKTGDMWVESTHQGTWDGAEGFDWEHDEQFDWSQIQGAKIWGWANNKWELVSDQQQVVSYTDVVNTAEYFVNQKIKGIVNDEGMLEVYLSKLEQTAQEIRSEVAIADSSVYSYIHQTATNIDLAVSNRPTTVVSKTQPTTISGRAPKNDDIWIQSKSDFKMTWDAVLDDDWGNDEDLDWGEIANTTIYVYKDGKWVVAQDGTVVAEDADLQVLSSTIDMNVKRYQTLDGKVEAHYAGLKVDAQQIRTYVQNRTAELGSEITQTAREIRAEVHASGSSLYSFISMTATQIRSEVGNAKSDMFSTITQTASQIRTEVNASKSQIYSSITQTASSIRLEVADARSDMSSSITQTASQIRSEVNSSKSQIYSSITQTASSIRLEVADARSDLSSSITQTASQIRSEVSNSVSNLTSSINVQANRISLVVEGTGANAKIKPAAIVTAINNGASSVIISANHINLDGYVKATDITANYIKGKIGDIDEVVMLNAYVTGNMKVRNGAGNQQNVNASIWDLDLSLSGNTYTLKRKRISDTDWVTVGTFSRATSLSGAWSSNTYTVTASPQGSTISVAPFVQPISSQGGVYVDLYVATGKSTSPGYDTHGTAKKLYLVKSGLTVTLKDQNSASSGSSFASITCSDGNLAAGNIKSGVSIFGVTGTYDVTLTDASWSNGNPYYDGSSNTVSVSTSGRASAITRSIPVTISEGAWSNGSKNIDITTINGSVVARKWISVPSIAVSFDCTDIGADAESNDNVIYGYAWHGSTYVGGSSQVIHMGTGSWSSGRIGVTSRLNDGNGKVIDRVYVSIPKPVSLQINRTNYSTSGKYEVGSFSKSRLSGNTYMTFTVGGKECYIVVNA